MGTIITVSSFKGGSGKSSTTALLAVNAAAKGLKVAVIDADPNASISTWHRTAYGGEPPLSVTECIDQDQIVTHALEVAEYHDLVLVDTAGFRNQTAVFAMGAAVLVLIPVLPDRHSVMEAAKTAKQAETVSQIARRTIPCRIVLNRWKPRGPCRTGYAGGRRGVQAGEAADRNWGLYRLGEIYLLGGYSN